MEDPHVARRVVGGSPPLAHELPKVRALEIEQLVETVFVFIRDVYDDGEAILDVRVSFISRLA